MTTNSELKLVFDEPVQRKKAPKHLADFAPADRKAWAKELGFQPFRAAQVATHYFSHLSNNPEDWTDIPAAERQVIADALTPKMIELVTTRTTDGGMTRKDLWKLHDGVLVESVLMRYTDRTTVCISSQAGCGMNCPFCATGQAGLTRNLSAAEITDQIVAAARACANGELPGGPTRLSNIVFMGMGEPLANYNAVVRTLRNIWLGSTAWIKSIVTGAWGVSGGYSHDPHKHQYKAMPWDADYLQFAVREPFPSKNSEAKIIFGRVDRLMPLKLVSLMPENGVIFSDGIEADFLEFNSGTEAAIEVSTRAGHLVV